MKVVFDEDFAKIWTDGYSPCIFSVVYHMPEVAQFKALCEAYLKLVKRMAHEFKDVYAISNMTEAQPIPLEAVFLYNKTYLPKQFQNGLRYKAYIKPRNVFSQFSLEEAMKNIDTTKVGVFNSFEDALHAVNLKRAEKSTPIQAYGQTVL